MFLRFTIAEKDSVSRQQAGVFVAAYRLRCCETLPEHNYERGPEGFPTRRALLGAAGCAPASGGRRRVVPLDDGSLPCEGWVRGRAAWLAQTLCKW